MPIPRATSTDVPLLTIGSVKMRPIKKPYRGSDSATTRETPTGELSNFVFFCRECEQFLLLCERRHVVPDAAATSVSKKSSGRGSLGYIA